MFTADPHAQIGPAVMVVGLNTPEIGLSRLWCAFFQYSVAQTHLFLNGVTTSVIAIIAKNRPAPPAPI